LKLTDDVKQTKDIFLKTNIQQKNSLQNKGNIVMFLHRGKPKDKGLVRRQMIDFMKLNSKQQNECLFKATSNTRGSALHDIP